MQLNFMLEIICSSISFVKSKMQLSLISEESL